jgi:hypothetical protein
MGGFLGIGESAEAKALKAQNALKLQEAERARQEAELRLAEKKARKGQETANVKLGTQGLTEQEKELEKTGKQSGDSVSGGMALGQPPKKKTGLQI